MSRRTPLMKAEATGRTLHDPKRFKNRREPLVTDPLGPPPKWMTKASEREAWATFSAELPWLNESHRTLVAIASELKGKLIAGEEISVNGLNLLRLCIGQMGGTPVDSSKVNLPEEKQREDDPSAKYF